MVEFWGALYPRPTIFSSTPDKVWEVEPKMFPCAPNVSINANPEDKGVWSSSYSLGVQLKGIQKLVAPEEGL